jgi:hypothetical protein
LAFGDPFVALPAIVAREVVDVIPAQRGDGRDEGVVDWPVPAQSGDRAFEVDGVPEDDGGGDQIEAAGPVALIFKRPIADLAEAVKKDGARVGVEKFPFLEVTPTCSRR